MERVTRKETGNGAIDGVVGYGLFLRQFSLLAPAPWPACQRHAGGSQLFSRRIMSHQEVKSVIQSWLLLKEVIQPWPL